MKKHISAGFAIFLLVAICVFYQEALSRKRYCLANDLDCISVSGGWKEVPLMTSDKSMILIKSSYLFFGKESIMEVFFISKEAISINFKNETPSNIKTYEFGTVEILPISPENEKLSSLKNFYGGGAYSAEKGTVIRCENLDCLNSVHSVSRGWTK